MNVTDYMAFSVILNISRNIHVFGIHAFIFERFIRTCYKTALYDVLKSSQNARISQNKTCGYSILNGHANDVTSKLVQSKKTTFSDSAWDFNRKCARRKKELQIREQTQIYH